MISVDSFGWIERLLAGSKAPEYNRVIDSVPPEEIVTSAFTLYEVYRKLKPAKGEAVALDALGMLRSTLVVPVDEQIAVEAADYSLGLKLSLADALIYATARHFGAELHTSDPDLRIAPGVVFH